MTKAKKKLQKLMLLSVWFLIVWVNFLGQMEEDSCIQKLGFSFKWAIMEFS